MHFQQAESRWSLVHLRCLICATVNDSRLEVKLHLACTTACSFQIFDDFQASLVRHLSEDNMFSIQPRGDHSGDEELRAIPVLWLARAAAKSF